MKMLLAPELDSFCVVDVPVSVPVRFSVRAMPEGVTRRLLKW
jgi:hypothetical protein